MKLFDLYADLSLDASGFERGVSKAAKMGNSLAGTLKGSVGGATRFVGQQVSATTVMLGNLMTDMARKGAEVGKQVFTTGVDYNRQKETYVTNFTTMLDGSSEAAEKLTADLEDMAASTPFAMADLADATQVLMQFGQDSETVMGTLESLGDIAMGDKNKLQSLTLAFAQASSSGKLMGQDLMQMINAGFNPLQTIVDKTGASMADLKEFMSNGKASAVLKKQMQEATKEVARMGDEASDGAKMLVQMAEDGAISAELLGQIFDIETSPGGKFYKAMENASKTFNGMVSTLEDDTSALMGKVMEPAFDFMTDTLLPKAIGVIDELDKAYDLGGLTGMASKATEILGETLGTWGTVAFDAGSGMLADVLSGLTGDTVNKGEIKKFFTGVASDGSAALNAIVTTGGGLLAGIWEGLSGDSVNKTNIVKEIGQLFSGGLQDAKDLVKAGSGLLGTIYTSISGQQATAENIGRTIGGLFSTGLTAANDLLDVGAEFLRDLDAAFKGDPQSQNQIQTFLNGLFDAAGDGMAGIIETSGNFLSNLYESITGDEEGAEKIKNLFSDVGEAVENTTDILTDPEEQAKLEAVRALNEEVETAAGNAVVKYLSMVRNITTDEEEQAKLDKVRQTNEEVENIAGNAILDFINWMRGEDPYQIHSLDMEMGNLEEMYGDEAVETQGWKEAVETAITGVDEAVDEMNTFLAEAVLALQEAGASLRAAANRPVVVSIDAREAATQIAPFSTEMMAVPLDPYGKVSW